MKGVFLYLWIINKRNIMVNMIKISIMVTLIIVLSAMIKKYNLLNEDQFSFVILLSLFFIIVPNLNFIPYNLKRIQESRFDSFIASTAVGYQGLIKGLTYMKMLITMVEFTVSIFLVSFAKKIAFGTSMVKEVESVLHLFLSYVLLHFIFIPLVVYLKDKNTAMMTMVVGLSIIRLQNEISVPMLLFFGVLLYFLSIKITEILWKKVN